MGGDKRETSTGPTNKTAKGRVTQSAEYLLNL